MDEATCCKTNGIGKPSKAHLNLKRTMKAQWDKEFKEYLSTLKPKDRAGVQARAEIIAHQQSRSLWNEHTDRA